MEKRIYHMRTPTVESRQICSAQAPSIDLVTDEKHFAIVHCHIDQSLEAFEIETNQDH